jgi:hypothetical protein
MFCLLYSPKQKIVKFHAQKQFGKCHVIDIFTSEDMENISLCIFQYLTQLPVRWNCDNSGSFSSRPRGTWRDGTDQHLPTQRINQE